MFCIQFLIYLDAIKDYLEIMGTTFPKIRIIDVIENKLEILRTIKGIYKTMPSTSVARLTDLSTGSHIKLSKTSKFTDHAIVTNVNLKERTFDVIKCICKDIDKPESEAEILEETMQFHEDKDVFLVKYKDRNRNLLIPQLTTINPNASVEVARYFKDNRVDFRPELMKDCEHFALCCTIGYPISFHEMNMILIAFGLLELFDKSTFSEMQKYMISKRRVECDDKEKVVTIKLQPNEEIKIRYH